MNDQIQGESEKWDLVLQPKRGWFDIDLRELVRYRDLIWLFVNRDFVSVYKQTILGPLWFIINPLFTTVIYSFIFGGLAKIPTDGVPQTLFYYGGTMLWGYFSACFNSGSDVFSGNAGLFSKVYFPRLTVPISKVFSNLITVAIQFGALLVFYVYFAIIGTSARPTWWILAVPLLVAQIAALGMGFGIIISSLTTKYRDLRQLVGFGVSLWMYATPVVYPLSQIPEKYRWLMALNPVSAPVEGFRIAMFGVGTLTPGMVLASLVSSIVLLFFGLMLFNHNERSFVDVV